MSLYVDKYRPHSLNQLDYHPEISTHLSQLASTDFPHLLVYGPSGAGKKTRVLALLRELYGPGVEKLKLDVREFTTPSNRKLELNIISSNYHLELTPSDVGMYDRIVIQDLVKQVAQTQQVSESKRAFKVIVFNDADSLTRDAQAALRRTMEKYMKNLRMILICSCTSKMIAPIRSRCLLMRIGAPSNSEIYNVLKSVSDQENMQLGLEFGTQLAQASGGNLRRALLMLEAARVSQDNSVIETDWEMFIKEIALGILSEQTPAQLQKIRTQLYELLSHCIPGTVILKTLTFELCKTMDSQIKSQVIQYAAEYESRLVKGNKVIFHMEAFVSRVMSIYKRYLMDLGMA